MFLESKDRIEFFFNDYLLDGLAVVNFGHEHCLPNHSFGPQVRDYFIIHYVLAGKGTFTSSNTTYSLEQGSFFLITPDDIAPVYKADAITPWEYVWFGLEGSSVEKILEELGYSEQNRAGKIVNFEAFNRALIELINSELLHTENSLRIQGQMITLISYLSIDNFNVSLTQHLTPSQKYIEQFIDFVKKNYWKEELTIQQISDTLGISNSYLSKIIKQQIEQTPVEYVTKYRMTKARFLIENTDHKIESISKAVGYSNPLSFSRAYKRIYKHSPRCVK